MSRSSNHSGDSKRYYDWLYHAYQDMLAAKKLIEDKRLYSQVVFHCQQAIEKGLKAFMLYKQRKLFDGHNLAWLCKQAAMMEQDFVKWLSKCAMLNRYYIETRYPADIPDEIDRELAEDILFAAEEMMEFICEYIKFDFNSYHKRRGAPADK